MTAQFEPSRAYSSKGAVAPQLAVASNGMDPSKHGQPKSSPACVARRQVDLLALRLARIADVEVHR